MSKYGLHDCPTVLLGGSDLAFLVKKIPWTLASLALFVSVSTRPRDTQNRDGEKRRFPRFPNKPRSS